MPCSAPASQLHEIVELAPLPYPPNPVYGHGMWLPRRALPALAYLLTGVPVGLVALVALPPLAVTGVGPPVLAIALAALERRRLRLFDARPVPSPHRPPGPYGLAPSLHRPSGPRGWLGTRLREAVTWQELAYAVLAAVALWLIDLVVAGAAICLTALPLLAPLLVVVLPAGSLPNGARLRGDGLIWLLPLVGVAVGIVMGHVVTAVAAGRAALVRAVLVPVDEVRLVELTRSRSRLVAGFDGERRRLERDLHDGVQQRLLSLGVTLGLARLELADQEDTELARLVVTAHEEAKATLEQVRGVVRGIHPWLLTDRGLGEAVADLAARAAVPVSTDIRIDGRLPQAAESAAYYVVSEALANVDRHSGARRAAVSARYDGRTLTVEIRDDGHGGADPRRGTGLQGLADRAGAAGARLLVSSPEGGPTVLRLEVPCRRSG